MRTLLLLFSSSCLVVLVSPFPLLAMRTRLSNLSEKAVFLVRAEESPSPSSSSSYDFDAALHPDNETWKVRLTEGKSNASSLSSSTAPSARHNNVIFSTLLIVCSFAATMSVLPLIAHAVDHPVDHELLGIPIPVPDVRYFISGGLCAACSHGVTVPIDVAKTRIQSDEEKRFSDNLFETMTDIVQSEGPQALLAGLGPTVVGYGLEGAAKFGLYESLKPIFGNIWDIPPGSDPSLPYLAASVVAGGVASLMLCPLEQTRIRLVTDASFRQDGLISGFSRLIQQEGVSSTLFGGISPMLSKQVPYTIGKQVSFDEFARMLYNMADTFSFSARQVQTEVSIAAAFMASIVACILSHPGDVLLTATFKGQEEGKVKTELPSFTNLVRDVWVKEGFSGFWTGLSARFFHVGAIITSQLVLYDFIKQLLGLPATGSNH